MKSGCLSRPYSRRGKQEDSPVPRHLARRNELELANGDCRAHDYGCTSLPDQSYGPLPGQIGPDCAGSDPHIGQESSGPEAGDYLGKCSVDRLSRSRGNVQPNLVLSHSYAES